MMTKLSPVWQDLAPATAPPVPLPRQTVTADVAIVGGGLTGLSAAYHLAARPGLRVVLLEAGHLGAGASGRNTGMLGPGVGQSLAALVRRLGASRAAALYRQTLGAVGAAKALIERERIDCELQMTGQLLRARSRGDRRRLALQARLMRDLELPVDVLDDQAATDALRLTPAPGEGEDGPAALRLPHAGLLHPGKLVAGLAARAAARGAILYSGARVLEVDAPRGGAHRPVRLAVAGGGEVLADQVVVATAGYTAGMGLLRARVLPVHLQALATAPLTADMLAALGWARREGVVEARRLFNYFRLTTDNRLVFGGAAPRYHWRGRPPADEPAGTLASLRRQLRAVFPAVSGVADLPVTHAWSGVIGYTLDALPVLGRDRDRPALIQAVGWCGHGLALSVASGAWIARLAERTADDAAEPSPLAWFRDASPALPGEALRWLSFRAAVGAMALMDHVA